jgi:hypothetical protein
MTSFKDFPLIVRAIDPFRVRLAGPFIAFRASSGAVTVINSSGIGYKGYLFKADSKCERLDTYLAIDLVLFMLFIDPLWLHEQ